MKEKYISIFEKLAEELTIEINSKKELFLRTKIVGITDNPTNEEKSSFLLQFLPFLDYIVFFHNDANVESKLRELGFAKNLLKWMIDINDIENEIRRLLKIEGFIFIPNNYFFASIEHLRIKFKIEFIESFGLNIFYNNVDANTLFLDFTNRLRRNNYNSKLNAKKDNIILYEQLMQENYDSLKKLSIELKLEKDTIIKSVIKALKGNTKMFVDLFEFDVINISKNTAYAELFPLFKLIFKDIKLFDENEFRDKDKDIYYDGNYRKYKYNKVKKLILKK